MLLAAQPTLATTLQQSSRCASHRTFQSASAYCACMLPVDHHQLWRQPSWSANSRLLCQLCWVVVPRNSQQLHTCTQAWIQPTAHTRNVLHVQEPDLLSGMLNSCLAATARWSDMAVSKLADALQAVAPPQAPRQKVRHIRAQSGNNQRPTMASCQRSVGTPTHRAAVDALFDANCISKATQHRSHAHWT
jgi:hypothetical protein